MKKRLFLLLAVAIIAVSLLVFPANAAEETCPCCGESATWTAISANTSLTNGHYYLTKGDIVFGTNTIADGKTVCLDLRGYQTIFNKNFTVESGGTLRVANGNIVTRGVPKSATDGGAFAVNNGGKLFLEDVNFIWDTTYGRDVPKGGFIWAEGQVSLTDTTLTGGKATSLGGNLFLGRTGELTMDGGSITGGTCPAGPCTYIRGKVTLKNNAVIDQLHIVPGSSASNVKVTDILNLDSSFTGSALLSFVSAPADGDDIGNVTAGADIAGLTIRDSSLQLKSEDGNLIAYLPIPVAIVQNGVVISEHNSMTEAMAQLADGQTLMLQRDLDETVTVTKDVTLDLNGNDLTAVNVTSGTLYVTDSTTDDYTVSDGIYGKIGQVSEGVQGLVIDEYERYLAYTEEGGTSFHKLRMGLTGMNLRGSVAGLYFESDFKGDDKVKALISGYGVAMSLNADDLGGTSLQGKVYTSLAKSNFNGSKAATSSILANVMSLTQGNTTNRRNANMKVYGRPYIKFTDGTLLWGTTQGRSLKEQVQLINAELALNPDYLSDSQSLELANMCFKFQRAMSTWEIPAVQAAWQRTEEETLKILTIGNSHANDSNWQLREVFQQQNPDKKVIVGVLYYSGCSVEQHVRFAQGNLAEYQYYKNETGEWIGNDTPKDTMKDALIDEQWDIILLQEMNIGLGQASTFANNNLQTLIDYVKSTAYGTPTLGFNMVWANPVTNDYWDADIRPTDLPNKWVERYEDAFGTDQQYMYECITENTQTYIASNENINSDYIMPSGTAVQYANNVLGCTDLDLYRDYTHISEFSRLMVSYLWYAKLTGETFDSIDDFKVDVIPQHLRHSRFTAEGDMAITDEMKQIMLEAINYTLENPYEVPETMQTSDPAADGELNVLMIGNSFCYYFPDELVEMAKASGQQLRICNVYFSGCRLSQHYTWLKNGNAPYDFFIRSTDSDSYIEINDVSLEYCLSQYNWDIITVQPGSGDVRNESSAQAALEKNKTYLDYLLGYYRAMYPMTQYAWHHTWAYQVGQTSHETPIVTTLEDQHAYDTIVGDFARLVCETYDLDRINSGEAWRIIRDNGYDNLCARLGKKWANDAPDNSGDGYHDGDWGGGQYLNACVWYEYLFGLDVRENTFVPTYDGPGLGSLNKNGTGAYELQIVHTLLQEAAHTAFSTVNND